MILCQVNVDDDDDDDQSEYDSDHEKDEDVSHDEDDVTNYAKGERHTCFIINACSISCRSFFSSCIIRCEPSSF